MRITITIDDDLFEQVMRYAETKNRSEALRVALVAYVKTQEKQEVLALRGAVTMEDNWRELRGLDTMPM